MILHLSTQQTGGAAIAALRIHEALLAAGEESHFLCRSGEPDAVRNIHVVPKIYERYWQRGLHKMGLSVTQYRKWERIRAKTNLPETVLSGIRSDYRLSRHPLIQKADIIHLHWVTGMFDWPDFFSNIRQPLVWTLHDMNPFMGLFHYEGDLNRSNTRSQELEKYFRGIKVAISQNRRNITCVSPSRWLSDKAKASEVLGHCANRVIHNTIDNAVFQPFPREFGRQVFRLSADKKVLLIVAESLTNHRKGMDLFKESLMEHPLKEDWEVIAVGGGNFDTGTSNIRFIGPIADPRLMAILYSTANLFVIPSREDNFPNTILESLVCGTPVVGLPAGGIPEAIQSPRDGVVATDISVRALSDALTLALQMHFDRKAIRESAMDRFNGRIIASEYRELYSTLFDEH